MRAVTTGTIESVDVRRGGHGTSAPKIDYSYTVEGRRHVSGQFAPGFLARRTTRTGGGRAASDYRAGQQVLVHYDPRRPQDACLVYGWDSWSVGLPLFLLGMGLQGWGERRGGRRGRMAQLVGWTLVPLGVLCLFLTYDVVRPSDLPRAGAIAVAVLAARLLYQSFTRRADRLAGGRPPR